MNISEISLGWSYSPKKIKLLDTITTNLIIKNSSTSKIYVDINYKSIDSSFVFSENSLSIQGIDQESSSIPSKISLPNIPSNESAIVSVDFKYIKDIFPLNIPIIVEVTVYYMNSGNKTLVGTITKQFYTTSAVGPNYIPGCNKLYNIAINGMLQSTSSGVPIVYYKSGNSYIYIEPSGNIYQYKIISNIADITEYQVNV